MGGGAKKLERATFGMSWFWFPEAQFGCVPGVVRTRVGFSGGTTPNPTYRTIGDHTETVDIEFDPAIISYAQLLELFWKNHDSSAVCSRQYMSAIFYHGEEQKTLAEQSKIKAQEVMRRPPQTEIAAAKAFFNAEDYHQKYLLQKHPELLEILEIKRGFQLIESSVAARLNGYIGGYGSPEAFKGEVKSLNLDPDAVDYVMDNFKYTKFR